MSHKNQQSFKQFLIEYDASDLQLQQDHRDAKTNKQEYNKAADDFKSQMSANRAGPDATSKEGEPQKGDVLQSPSGKQFVVQGRTNAGFRVRELGGNGKEGNLPHGRKYNPVGKTPVGKTIFKLT